MSWSDLEWAFPVTKLANDSGSWGQAWNWGKDKLGFGGSDAPKEFQDRAQIANLINGGYGQNGQGGITNYQSPQLQMGQDPFRQAQLQQLGQLQGIASGQQQGAGELATQRQFGNAQAAQQAMARMGRGGGAGPLAYRNAANQSAALGISAAGMGQQAAMQDQMNAQGLMGQVAGAGRGADINVANANAGYQQGANQLNSQNYIQLLNQLNSMNQSKYNADLGIGAQKDQANASLAGGVIGGIGAAIASDERLKKDVKDAGESIDKMLDGLKAKSGKYKDERHGKGEWNWVMAQDLEKSEAGKRLVNDTPDGKMLDVGKVISTSLAAAARLNERVRKLEGACADA